MGNSSTAIDSVNDATTARSEFKHFERENFIAANRFEPPEFLKTRRSFTSALATVVATLIIKNTDDPIIFDIVCKSLQTAGQPNLGGLDRHLSRPALHTSGSTHMSENRVTQRNRTFKGGTIEFNGAAIDCTVRNVSDTGAALAVESPVGIPEQFMLFVNADQTFRQCRVVWRQDKRIGVTFTGRAREGATAMLLRALIKKIQ